MDVAGALAGRVALAAGPVPAPDSVAGNGTAAYRREIRAGV